MSADHELGYASEFLRGGQEALSRALGQRPDLTEIVPIQDQIRSAERALHDLINQKREREK